MHESPEVRSAAPLGAPVEQIRTELPSGPLPRRQFGRLTGSRGPGIIHRDDHGRGGLGAWPAEMSSWSSLPACRIARKVDSAGGPARLPGRRGRSNGDRDTERIHSALCRPDTRGPITTGCGGSSLGPVGADTVEFQRHPIMGDTHIGAHRRVAAYRVGQWNFKHVARPSTGWMLRGPDVR